MSATEDLMAFLQEHPYMFDLTRDKVFMRILKEMEKGGKTATELAKEYNIDHDELSKKLNELVDNDALARVQQRDHWIYFLSFPAKKLLELYYKAKQ